MGIMAATGIAIPDVRTTDYKYGTLIIDFVDAKANELMWYSSASKALEDVARDPKGTIDFVVNQMFNEYRFLAGQKEPVPIHGK